MKINLSFFIFLFSLQALGTDFYPSLLCDGPKITPVNYTALYLGYQKRFKSFKDKERSDYENWVAFMENERVQAKSPENIKCDWNAFILTDFIFYNEQESSIFKNSPNKVSFLNYRNKALEKWLDHINEDFMEKSPSFKQENEKIEFSPKEFSILTYLTELINRSPRGDSEKDQAIKYIHNLVDGRSIFNGIFVNYIITKLTSDEILTAQQCIHDRLQNVEGNNIYNEMLLCSNNNLDLLLDILGTFASQRIYLTRDLQSEIENKLTKKDYLIAKDNIKLGALIYFELETYSNKYGIHTVYPDELESEMVSHKPYHFYSVAFIANKLRQEGFTDDVILETANHYAKKYKKNITWVGYIYNILLLQGINKGASSDTEPVIKEQQKAISWLLKQE